MMIRACLLLMITLPLGACQSVPPKTAAVIPGVDTAALPGPPGLMGNILAVMYDDARSIAEIAGE